MNEESLPRLLFPYGFDDNIAFEAEMKGVYYHAVVELPNKTRVRVGFYDAVRVAQDLERGDICVALPGMIIVPKITLDNMINAVRALGKGDFFVNLQTLMEGD
ncbi:hypothetical protein [Paludibaculum fermentans]|uniref:hypothetical protein n=1 Tax=Paludibaculum fermentans TaxID=1473598 RepID=UPI003EC09630